MSGFGLVPNVRAYSDAFKSPVVQTTNATATAIHTVTVPDRCTWSVIAQFLAYNASGALVGRFMRAGTFKRSTTVTQCNATQAPISDDESNGSTSCNFLISSPTIVFRGVGLAATTFNWSVKGRIWVLMWP